MNMRARWVMRAAVAAWALAPAAGRADWNVGDPHKWVQMPHLGSLGMDVNATYQFGQAPTNWPYVKVLADDFRCEEPGPITDIHIWGSWLNNNVYSGTTFKLSIHADEPAGPLYSHPSTNLLWQAMFAPGMYTMREYAVGMEQFFEPNTDRIIGEDTICYQYNFHVAESPFVQQGSPANPVVYWLDVQALVGATNFVFGWKTSLDHWNDDAVYADTEVPGGPPVGPAPPPVYWKELRYPVGHPYYGQSIDLAYVIVPEPGVASLLLMAGAGFLAACWLRMRRG